MSSDTTTKEFSLTWTQKLLYMAIPLVLSFLIVQFSSRFKGWAGNTVFIVLGIGLGLVTWFISAGWAFHLEITGSEVRVRDARGNHAIPLDKVGMLVRAGGFPFPTLWLVLRSAEGGQEMPSKGFDPQARALVEAYQRRNPGKKVTIYPLPGGHIRSIAGFAAELKRRVPPITLDERLNAK